MRWVKSILEEDEVVPRGPLELVNTNQPTKAFCGSLVVKLLPDPIRCDAAAAGNVYIINVMYNPEENP